ncbi:MAG: hypothetical protein PHY44_02640 [Lachnospiraceae bacterium]|nr:hypothetical protein [Lachnospiraceae bacterium]
MLFRINTLVFIVPRLNERREDISILSNHFLKIFCMKYGKNISGFAPSAMRYLLEYDYQGNVRELQNFVERAVIICESDEVTIDDFNDIVKVMKERRMKKISLLEEEKKEDIFDTGLALKDLEELYISHVFKKYGESAKKTCEVLKIDRSTLWRKMKVPKVKL